MATSNYVLHKLQKAAQNWLQSVSPIADIGADRIYSGLNKTKRHTPCIVCLATEAEPSDHASGNQLAILEVRVITDSDKEEDTTNHDERVEALANQMAQDSIATNLTAALADFTAFLVRPAGQVFGIDDNTDWVSGLKFAVTCCGSDIS